MVSKMTNHNNIISIKAKNGFFMPKNSNDHNAFSNNWKTNNQIAFFVMAFSLVCFDQTIPKEIPIMMYNIVQTGAKIQFGGLKKGLFNVGYQFKMLSRVGILDRNPIKRQITTDITILIQLLFFKISFV